ncbi:tail fiber assembly protein [Symbiopectobacterium sp.]|uniref:tail fiber assembly protein n=1 Tax=Symbiopectobacterium sp. TaxID=2952789 RepID=UPI003F357AFB
MYYYSAKENTFCPAELRQSYIDAGSFPEDVIEVNDDVWLEFAGNPPPDGKERAVGEAGLPVWIDIPPPTPQQRMDEAERKKAALMQKASAAMAPLQDAVDLAMVTEAEKVQLVAWKKYRVLLNRLDISGAPDIKVASSSFRNQWLERRFQDRYLSSP